ncbi:MAG TPA: phage tail tip lysozyme [Candidatus Saccharibacteria bacterium]|nr:phage tail tip lysozyme [Candidatus Saccharibacteria bacterium]
MLLNTGRVLLFALAFVFVADIPVQAAGFTEPEEITNREKAHLNIGFTGGGDEEDEGDSEACSADSGAIGSISKDFSLGSDPKERRVNLIKALMDEYGLTAEQASGPVGNFIEESGGDHLPPDFNQNDKVGAPPNGSLLGYGWAQWSGGRKTNFVSFLRNNDYLDDRGHGTDAGNFAYLKKELTSTYKSTITELKKKTKPEDAALSFHTTFERSSDSMSQIQERATSARQAFNEYKSSGGATGGGSSDSCGATVSSVNFGQVAFPLKGSKKVVNNPGIFSGGTTQIAGHPYTAYDIMSDGGTPIRAFISGRVSYFFNDTCGGDSVTIWNEELKIGISYMHMNHGGVEPKMNQRVRVGEVIGSVGRWNGGCGGDHLHIDASTDKIRQPCSRDGCSDEVKSHFRSMGKELFETYQTLPD